MKKVWMHDHLKITSNAWEDQQHRVHAKQMKSSDYHVNNKCENLSLQYIVIY